MKRFVFALGLVGATTFAAPLAAQSRNDGPWWDPSNTGSRQPADTRSGTIYDRDGGIYDRNGTISRSRADGQWHRVGRDNSGNFVYARVRRDSNGRLIEERARRDTRGQYRVFDRRVLNSNTRGVYDRDRNNDGYEDRTVRDSRVPDRNDRWEQNNGHDNGKHNGWYKNKNKNKNKHENGRH
ncbi:MAG TPA: hypothetical protein VHM24_01560 [Gemmatimonadaceae bacterium]|nr:hypothetical protein [Gemmatimonadaceae bacterium]